LALLAAVLGLFHALSNYMAGMEVESVLGEGSVFRRVFPLCDGGDAAEVVFRSSRDVKTTADTATRRCRPGRPRFPRRV
jgi:hypothetical protein